MENWDGWLTLLRVVETGTLSGAAAQLRIDATTIGRRLSRLEAKLGRRLLARRGGRLEPTATCRALLPRVEEAAQQLESARTLAVGESARTPRRPVRITSVDFLFDQLLAPQIAVLTAGRQPIELLAEDKNFNIARREADLALRLGPPQGSRRGARQVGWVRYAIYAAIDRDPAQLPWAALDTSLAPLPEVRYVEAQAKGGGIQFRAGKLQTLAAIAAAGAARVVLPHLIGDRHPRLRRFGDLSVLKRPLWLIESRESSAQVATVARRIEQIARQALKG